MDAGFAVGASIVVFVTFGAMACIAWVRSRGEGAVNGAKGAAIAFAVLSAIAVVVGATSYVSNPDAFGGAGGPAPAQQAGGEHGGNLAEMVAKLRARLEQNPSDGAGWALLGRTYMRMGQAREASDALAKAIPLVQGDASLYADYVDTHVSGTGGKWDVTDKDALAKALSIDPKNIKALALAGTEAYQRKDYPTALGYWERMKAAALPGSREAQMAESNIAEVRQLMAGK